MKGEEKWPRVIAELTDLAAHGLRQAGIADAESRRLAVAVTGEILTEMGGRLLYLPKAAIARQAARNEEIWASYDGTPACITAMAKQHDLSEIAVYRILERQRRLRHATMAPLAPSTLAA